VRDLCWKYLKHFNAPALRALYDRIEESARVFTATARRSGWHRLGRERCPMFVARLLAEVRLGQLEIRTVATSLVALQRIGRLHLTAPAAAAYFRDRRYVYSSDDVMT
jgi:hypothetical protein